MSSDGAPTRQFKPTAIQRGEPVESEALVAREYQFNGDNSSNGSKRQRQ